MYFSADRMRAVEHPNRLTFYFTTMVWEWLLTAYVLFGVRRHGKLLGEVTGAQWKTARDLFRDLGVALVFWIGALVVLGLTAIAVAVPGFAPKPQLPCTRRPRAGHRCGFWCALLQVFVRRRFSADICKSSSSHGPATRPLAYCFPPLIFGVCHIYQGTKAVVVITVYGLMFGILAQWRKSMRPGMMTHALHDSIGGLAVRFLPK